MAIVQTVMIRELVIAALLLAGACESRSAPQTSAPPARPHERAFSSMSPDEQCRATEVRAMPCTDELLVEQTRDVSESDDLAAVVNEHMAKGQKTTEDEARAMHRTNCTASAHYASAVMACSSAENCAAFARCVVTKDRGPAK
jgi:hypothetical protein